MDVTIIMTAIGTVISVIGANIAMLKFMLKDTHKELLVLEKNFAQNHEDHKAEMKEFKEEMRHVNNRLDGLYRTLVYRTYGNKDPEDLK